MYKCQQRLMGLVSYSLLNKCTLNFKDVCFTNTYMPSGEK